MTIELKGLTKRFGQLTAVDAVDLDVGDGEVLCLLGPSGCGKTTTLRMVAGLEFATEGDVLLGGKRVNDLAPRERNVAMSFQFYALYPSLTVADNLAYPLHAEGLSKSDIQSRVAQVSKTLQLDSILNRTPSQLAEGEKQRVAVGRSIIRDPVCFLFDEPLSRLDVQLREEMRGEIKEVLQDLSRPTVIVTHDQLEALTMADRIAVMRDGRLEQVDTPHNVFQNPVNLFVASFIGTPQMNLLPATLTQANESGLAEFSVEGGQSMTITVDPRVAELRQGSKVTLGVRPRNLEISHEPVAEGLSTKIDIVEPMGAETLAHMNDGHHDLRLVTDWRVPLAEGDHVHTRFPPGSTHVFTDDEQVLRSSQ
ncbi:MAG: ABC transporter ATP-binding protein [Pseudomonadota bacterium]